MRATQGPVSWWRHCARLLLQESIESTPVQQPWGDFALIPGRPDQFIVLHWQSNAVSLPPRAYGPLFVRLLTERCNQVLRCELPAARAATQGFYAGARTFQVRTHTGARATAIQLNARGMPLQYAP